MTIATNNQLTITFQLNFNDVYRSNISIAVESLTQFRAVIRLIVIVLIGSAAFGFASGPPGIQPSVLRGGIWGVLFFPAFLFSMCYVTTYFAAKSMFKSSVNVRNPIHYVFLDTLVIQEMSTGRSELQWATFVKILETKTLFLLFVQKHLAHPLPKRAFAGGQELAAFRDLVRRHVQDASLQGQNSHSA
ncbi:MAG: YcxB family protein [Candidatus Acidiferrales bacterium]